MTMTHSPGPWTIDGDRGAIVAQTPSDNEYHDVCSLWIDDPTEDEIERQIANATLIAAAPELLAALERMVRSAETDFDPLSEYADATRDEITQARTAIAKAKGVQS
jgi:hypothetical protein